MVRFTHHSSAGWKFNVDKVIEQTKATLKFRKEFKMEELRKSVVGLKQKDFPHYAKIVACHPHMYEISCFLIFICGLQH